MNGFGLKPEVRQPTPDRMVYGLSSGFRLTFGGVAAVLLFALLQGSSPLFVPSNTLGIVLFLVCALAALYRERWTFDRNLDVFQRETGLVFLAWKRHGRLRDIQGFVLRSHTMVGDDSGRRSRWLSRGFVVLSIRDGDGSSNQIDAGRAGRADDLRRTGERLAAFCGVPLDDRTQPAGTE